MKAKSLYAALSQLFDIKTPLDDWEMQNKKYLTGTFKNGKQKDMGVMVDNAKIINKVYTATFLTSEVVNLLKKRNEKNALVFVHHPKDWDIERLRQGGELFTELTDLDYKFLMQNAISVYVAHQPLDNNRSEININKSLASAIGIEIVKNHLVYYKGASLGVICKTNGTLGSLRKQFEKAIGHKSFLQNFGGSRILDGLVAIVGGGGNDVEIYRKLVEHGVNTYITGVVNWETGFQPAVDAAKYAKAKKINIIAGTHYSTEKFGLIDMVKYFEKLGLQAEFVEQKPKFSDYTFKL